MKIWGMSTEEFTTLLDESFTVIKKTSRKAEAQHYARTRILASNLEAALERLRSTTLSGTTTAEEKLCA